MKIINNVNELLDVVNLKKDDTINIMTPQFEREYKLTIDFKPENSDELKLLIKTCPADILLKIGLRKWTNYEEIKNDKNNYLNKGEIHYLFPGEWYNLIPDGFEVTGIFGRKYLFKNGKTDDDIRFGCLSFGFVRSF